MDFGPDSFLCSNNGGSFALDGATAEIHKQKCYGFGFLKQERERAVNEDELLREFKMAKTCSSSSSLYTEAAMLRFPLQRSSNGGTEAHQQMLSFSSPNSSPYYHQSSTPFARNSGYGYGGSMQGVRGPFTPSQWMELEHQALIYKYLNANVPIPSYLLNPIRKAFESAAFSSSLPSNPLGGRGWGGFQLGFANTDPEPGRCRRTDGKKWRCSRDAVADQKYCERHINRGRHRSRKPVEAHSKLTPIPSSTSLLPSAAPATTYLPTTTTRVEPKEQAAFQESSFGLVCSDSLLNPLNRSSSLIKNYDHKPDHHHHHHHPLRQFMDEWPKTQLSISIPMAVASDFTSSTSSPTNEKPTSPPPRLSGELEMGLGVGTIGSQRQANWVPISWEPSMGGPLGEVLQTTSNSTSECKNTQQPLNLIDRWDNHSPGMASSPTGVLQRAAFASLSNSSATSSPRAEGINAGPMNP